MAKHVIWFGPVSREQRAGATIEGAEEHFVSCTGNGVGGTARCRALAEGYADREGRHLPGLLRKLGIPEGEELYFGAFSAGGSAIKILLAHPDDRAAVRAVMLADATYELSGSDGRPASSPSLVAYAAEAMESGAQMLVATASGVQNNTLGRAEPSGAQTLERIAGDIEARSGQRFDQMSHIEGLDGARAARVWRRGSVVLADYGHEFTHAEHATKLAPVLWPRMLQPWVDRRGATITSNGHEPVEEQGTSMLEGTREEGHAPLGVLLAVGAVATIALGVTGLARSEGASQEARARARLAAWRR